MNIVSVGWGNLSTTPFDKTLNEADPNTEKFTRNFAVGEAEKAAVLGKLKGKCTAVRANSPTPKEYG